MKTVRVKANIRDIALAMSRNEDCVSVRHTNIVQEGLYLEEVCVGTCLGIHCTPTYDVAIHHLSHAGGGLLYEFRYFNSVISNCSNIILDTFNFDTSTSLEGMSRFPFLYDYCEPAVNSFRLRPPIEELRVLSRCGYIANVYIRDAKRIQSVWTVCHDLSLLRQRPPENRFDVKDLANMFRK